MKIVDQERSVVYQLYRKGELNRLKKKIQQIKNRKPLLTINKNCSLPKIGYNRSFSPERMNQITVQNRRLNKKIVENMLSYRKSGLDMCTTSEVTRVYKLSFGNLDLASLKTARKGKVMTQQDKENGWAANFTKRGLFGKAVKQKSRGYKETMNNLQNRNSKFDEIMRKTNFNLEITKQA